MLVSFSSRVRLVVLSLFFVVMVLGVFVYGGMSSYSVSAAAPNVTVTPGPTRTPQASGNITISDGTHTAWKVKRINLSGATVSSGVGVANIVVSGGGSNVKVFRALLNQSGSNAPTAVVIENTLGGVPVWSRDSSGEYLLTLAGAFPDAAKIYWSAPVETTMLGVRYVIAHRNDSDSIWVGTVDDSAIGRDDVFSSTPIEILVYP